MRGKLAKQTSREPSPGINREYLTGLDTPAPVAGISGPGRWLVFTYLPTAIFSLKISMATSSVGRTLVVPTPYTIKMAFVDAAFRLGLTDAECAALLESLVGLSVRIAPPHSAVVTHTFVKVRQEPHDPRENPLRPYIDSIAYREFVSHSGSWQWAFDLAMCDAALAENLTRIAPHINYIGKRGSFIQYTGVHRLSETGSVFTQEGKMPFILPERAHIVPLDDFGPEANLQVLSSYTPDKPGRDKHRKFIETVVPLGIVSSGPGFTEYRAKDN